MADRSTRPIVHFVGSIPLPDSETVFRTLSKAVGSPAKTRLGPTIATAISAQQ